MATIGISGATGFIGKALSARLSAQGHQVVPTAFDIREPLAWSEFFSANPDLSVFFHLAGISHVPTCEKDPKSAFENNTEATASLLFGLGQAKAKAHLVFFSTAQVYKATETADLSFSEKSKLGPQNTYAWSKFHSESILSRACPSMGVTLTTLRLFNHSHRSQSPDFFLPHLYREILSRKETGSKEPISVGNLDVERDIGTLPDLLDVLEKVAERRPEGVFNVSTGVPKNLGSVARELARALGVEVTFRTDPSRVRPGEPKRIYGDSSLLQRAVGWQPRSITEVQLVKSFLAEV